MKLLLCIKLHIKSTFLQNVTQSLSSASSRAVYRPKVVHPIRYKRTTCKNVVEEIYSPNWTAMKRSCTQVAHGQRHAPSSWLPLIAGSAMSCSYNSLHQGHRPNVNAIPMRMLVCSPNYSPGNAMMVMDFFFPRLFGSRDKCQGTINWLSVVMRSELSGEIDTHSSVGSFILRIATVPAQKKMFTKLLLRWRVPESTTGSAQVVIG